MIEALTPDTAEESLADSIRTRGVIRSFENLNVTRLRNPSEAHPKLAVVITDEILRPHTKGGSFPQLLCSPHISGISCHPDVNHSARVQFDDEEGEQRVKEEICDREARRRPRSARHACVRRSSSSAHVVELCSPVAYVSEWCGRQTRIPNLSNSPRIRFAPHSRLSLAISLIKATASSEIFGLGVAALDLYFQKSRKPWRCHRSTVSG
jgi:hypothetical protein